MLECMPQIDIWGSLGRVLAVGVAVFARRTCDVDGREASVVCGGLTGAILALLFIDDVADISVLLVSSWLAEKGGSGYKSTLLFLFLLLVLVMTTKQKEEKMKKLARTGCLLTVLITDLTNPTSGADASFFVMTKLSGAPALSASRE